MINFISILRDVFFNNFPELDWRSKHVSPGPKESYANLFFWSMASSMESASEIFFGQAHFSIESCFNNLLGIFDTGGSALVTTMDWSAATKKSIVVSEDPAPRSSKIVGGQRSNGFDQSFFIEGILN